MTAVSLPGSRQDVWWLERPGGAPEGPYSEREVLQLIKKGLQAGSRIWSAATGRWQSVRQWRSGSRYPPGRSAWIALIITSLLFIGAFLLTAQLVFAPNDDLYTPAQDVALWTLAGLALAGFSLLCFVGWRRVGRTRSSTELGGMLQIAATLFLIFGATLAGLQIRDAIFLVPSKLTAAQWTYQASADPKTHRVRFTGEVGPGYGRRMEQLLDQAGSPAIVEISSNGGLTGEAMRAAKAIEAHKTVTVVARDHCVSACLIVLMSAERRLADAGMNLAFHATAPIVQTKDKLADWSFKQAVRESDDYLVKRGTPADVVAATNRLGPTMLYRIPAPLAYRRGILTGLVEGERLLSADEARALGEQSVARMTPAVIE